MSDLKKQAKTTSLQKELEKKFIDTRRCGWLEHCIQPFEKCEKCNHFGLVTIPATFFVETLTEKNAEFQEVYNCSVHQTQIIMDYQRELKDLKGKLEAYHKWLESDERLKLDAPEYSGFLKAYEKFVEVFGSEVEEREK